MPRKTIKRPDGPVSCPRWRLRHIPRTSKCSAASWRCSTEDAIVPLKYSISSSDSQVVPLEDEARKHPRHVARKGRLACTFHFLACSYRSDDLKEWDMHSRSHLFSHLPVEVVCPFRCMNVISAESGEAAWQQRMVHIIAKHTDEKIDTTSWPDESLIYHLWRNRIIDSAQTKELVEHGRLSARQVLKPPIDSLDDPQTSQNFTDFSRKLYNVLQDPHTDNVISWTKEGDRFAIRHIGQFEEDILPEHFKLRQFAAFARQLHVYGFRRVVGKSSDDSDVLEYRHPGFKRDSRDANRSTDASPARRIDALRGLTERRVNSASFVPRKHQKGREGEGTDENNISKANGTGSEVPNDWPPNSEQRFQCTEHPPCHLNFSSPEDLAKHIRTHTAELPFRCRCSRRFSRRDTLRRHAMESHYDAEIKANPLNSTNTDPQFHDKEAKVHSPERPAPAYAITDPNASNLAIASSSISPPDMFNSDKSCNLRPEILAKPVHSDRVRPEETKAITPDVLLTSVQHVQTMSSSNAASEASHKVGTKLEHPVLLSDLDTEIMLADLRVRLESLHSHKSLVPQTYVSSGLTRSESVSYRSAAQDSRSTSMSPRRGRIPEYRASRRRTTSAPSRHSCDWSPHISVFGPQSSSSSKRTHGRSQASEASDRTSHSSASAFGHDHYNRDEADASEQESDGDDDRPWRRRNHPSNMKILLASKSSWFPCLNTIAEPEAFRNHQPKFEHISQLARHMKKHDFYVCHKCIEKFDTPGDFIAHEWLPHSRCRAPGCRRYRACLCEADLQTSETFVCGACLRTSQSQFDALLELKWASLQARQPPESAEMFDASFELGLNEDTMNGVETSMDDSFRQVFVNPSDTGSEQLPCQALEFPTESHLSKTTFAPREVAGMDLTHPNMEVNIISTQETDIRRRQQLTQEMFDLRDKVVVLEQQLSQREAPNPALESVLGMVWQELIQLGSDRTLPNAPLYNLVKCVAPNVIRSNSRQRSPRLLSEQSSNGSVDLNIIRNNIRQRQRRDSAGPFSRSALNGGSIDADLFDFG